MKGALTCECSRPAISLNPSNPHCAVCREIEKRNAAAMIRYTNIKTKEDISQAITRYNQDRWADNLPKGLIPPIPEECCGVVIDGYKRYYL